jgi:hypothetical protein
MQSYTAVSRELEARGVSASRLDVERLQKEVEIPQRERSNYAGKDKDEAK